ncbi:MAG: flagellar motor switch protein FliG, partial [Lentisphaerae bacterium]
MDDVEKAAILLLSLEKPLAAEVLSQLPRPMVEKVTLRLAQIDHVSREKQKAVFEEFYAMMKDHTPIERGSMDLANELLQQSLGTEGANAILENVKQTINSLPFGFLQKTGPDNLLTFIVEEHPQTIALIMSHLPTQLAADVLSGLDPEKQLEVIHRIATMEQTSPE